MFNLGFPTASRVAQHDNPGNFHDIIILRWTVDRAFRGSKGSFEWIVVVGDTIRTAREKRVGIEASKSSRLQCGKAARSAAGSNPRHEAHRVANVFYASKHWPEITASKLMPSWCGNWMDHYRIKAGRHITGRT